jgi:magnesium-transporting ATPase (P-type)
MENQDLNLFSLQVDETSKSNITSTARWVTIIVVCSIIGVIINIYLMLKPKPKIDLYESDSLNFRTSAGGDNIASEIIGIVVTVVLIIFLMNFARFAKAGVENNNIQEVNKGFANLKNYFLTLGILFIIVLILFLLALTFVGSIGM